MGDEVALVWVQVRLKPTFAGHLAFQFANDPVCKTQALDDFRLRLFLGRHLLQRYLRPNGFPRGRIRLINRPEILEREIALLGFVVVTIQTMAVQKLHREVFEITLSRFAGRVDVRSLSSRAKHGVDRHPEGEGQLVHAITSLSGPEPESNLAAIFSDML